MAIANMQKNLRAALWRPITLLVLPHESRQTLRLRLPAAVLITLVGAWAFSIGLAAFLVARRVNYEAMRLMNSHLAEENERYAQEVAKAEALTQRLGPLERELRRALGRTRNIAAMGAGEGGPQVSFLPEDIPTRVSRLTEVGEKLFSDYQGLASLVSATPAGWPVKGWITSEFGERISPYTGEVGTLHTGLDIANKTGTPIIAAADGIAVHAGWTAGGYGKLVEISHGYGYATFYGHCSRLKASPGQRVRKGDIIAYVGATGNATGPHLHYEIRLYGVPVNPKPFMK